MHLWRKAWFALTHRPGAALIGQYRNTTGKSANIPQVIADTFSLPIDRVPAFLLEDAALVEQRFPGTEASGYGHLGDGNVHFHVRARDHDAAAITRMVAAA